MAKTYNGWTALDRVPSAYFTAPNGKRVYCNNADVATIFGYVAQQWHERIRPLEKATYNIGDPAVRMGHIVIHSYRAPNRHIGTGNKSNHRSATGMDIQGDLFPYEATNPPHLRGPGYWDGFTDRQRNELVKIRNEIGKNSRGMWVLRLGIHFPVGKRDGMHTEIAPGVTATDVKATAAAIRAAEVVIDLTEIHRMLLDLGYTADESGVRAFQKYAGLLEDGIPGPITQAALEATMSAVLDQLAQLGTQIGNLANRVEQIHQRQGNSGTAHNNIMGEVKATRAAVEQTAASVWSYRNPGYPQRDAHGLIRDAATAKQLAAKSGVLTTAQINDTPTED